MEVVSQQNLFDLGLAESLGIESPSSEDYLELVELNVKNHKPKDNVKTETTEELMQVVLALLAGQNRLEEYILTHMKQDLFLANKQISKLVKSVDKLSNRVDFLTSELEGKVKFLEQIPSADTMVFIRQLRTNGMLVGEIAKKLNDAGIYTTAGTVWTSELIEYVLKESNNRNKIK